MSFENDASEKRPGGPNSALDLLANLGRYNYNPAMIRNSLVVCFALAAVAASTNATQGA
jgi:hypothetical protein